MRKLFILLSVLALSITAHAADIIYINTETEDALRLALNDANDGDEIVMAAGTYIESPTNYIAFASKGVVVRAADGANVILKPHVPITLSGGARAEFRGIKIDVSELCSVNDYSHLIYPSDNAANNRLILDGCEVYGYTEGKAVIASRGSNKLDSLIINNCKFYNHTTRSCVFLENTENKGLIITNSTFYNIATGTADFNAGIIDNRNAAAKVRFDHCTFYNVIPMNTDYSCVSKNTLSDGIVSNCIFMLPSAQDGVRAMRGVTANNCLTYNYIKDSNTGIHSSVTQNNCFQADPLFADASNGDFSLAGNWVTMSISPARGAATDGSDLGDPRWYTAETLPSTNFASAYDLLGTKALLSGRIGLNGSNHIAYNHNSEIADGTAKWKLHVSRACYISVVADREAGNSLGCQLTLTVKDADGNIVGLPLNAAASYNDNDISFPGTIFFSEEGDYTLILTNSTLNSTAVLEKITLTYEGGAVQNISTSANTTLNVADAWFSGCTRDNDKAYIQYPSSETSSAWIKWNIATSETKYYDLTVNVNTENNHGFTAAIYEDEEAEPVTSVTEGSFVETKGVLALELGRVNLVGGKNYVVKVTNAPSGSQAKVTSVVFAPVVATATELPGTLAFSNAVLSGKANITDGMLYFNEPGADKDPRGQWAQWEVTTDHNGLFLFSMGVTSTNEQSYKITILDNLDNVLDYYESSPGSGDKTLTHYFALNTGSYFVKVENTRSFSKGHLTSLVVTEPAGVVTLNEAATGNESWVGKVVAPEAEGPLYDVQIIRTIKAGMYNTFCLPFAVSSDQCKDIFGSDVQIRTLEEATVEEGDFVLNLNFKVVHDIYQGTPVLIKTSRDIVNPVFAGVKFTRETPSATTKTNANFVGNFVTGTIPASENNLFLGANNTLYFPTVDMPILGMRAYFVIHDAPVGAVKRARIIEREQIITDVELVAEQPNAKSQKILRDGQLIIIRDGNMYNVMGAKLQ